MFLAGGPSFHANGTYTTDFHSRMFEVAGQRVLRLADFDFPMDRGLCLTVDDSTALLCSSYTLTDRGQFECWNFDGGVTIRSGRTNDNHFRGGLANYRDGAIIISGEKNDAGSSEIYDPIMRDWRMHPFPYNRPVFQNLSNLKTRVITPGQGSWSFPVSQPLVSMIKCTFLVAPGLILKARVQCSWWVKTYAGSSIGKAQISDWIKIFCFKIQAYTSQSLLQRRKSFSSLIHRGNAIVHFGGEGTRNIEYWRPRSDGLFTILKSDYQLTGWSDTPMAFVVDKNDYS